MTTDTFQGLTAEQWREKSRRSYQQREESWERSDTDGFLSQWASGVMASEYEAKAVLAENGGMTTTRVLFSTDGTVASTHTGWGQWGQWWRLNDEAAEKFGKRFFSPSKAKDPEKRYAADKAKGFTEGIVKVKGYVALHGKYAVAAGTFPDVDALKAGDFEIVTADAGPDKF